jgi:sucrose-phosphate synthase
MWKKSEDSANDSDLDSPNDSLKDIKDISLNLKLSLDGDEKTNSGRTKLENVVKKLSDVAATSSHLETHNTGAGSSSKLPILRRRKHIIVIAIDSATQEDLIKIIRNIFEASQLERQNQSVGFVLSTSLTMSEVHSLLTSGGLQSTDFDAFICTSGSDLYYPDSNADDMLSPQELPFALDLDYHSQIEYRWGGEGLRKTLIRWSAMVTEKKSDKEEQVVVMDEDRSSSYCFSFKMTNPEAVRFPLPVRDTIFFLNDIAI